MKKDEIKPMFYDIFRFGPEFEMEIRDRRKSIFNFEEEPNPSTLSEFEALNHNLMSYTYRNIGDRFGKKLLFIGDGSLAPTKSGTECIELIAAEPFISQEEEDEFIERMKLAIPEFKSESGEDIFAFYNTTASTHFHWSFKNLSDAMLYVYDTRRFEKFFFERYLATFKSEKFLARLDYQYCRAPQLKSAAGPETKPREIMRDIKEHTSIAYMSERTTVGRRRWLNTQSIDENTGMEVRIFPFLQTYAGVEQTIRFMKNVILDYYLLEETQAELKLMQIYVDYISNSNRDSLRAKIMSRLKNEWKQIAFDIISNNVGQAASGEAQLKIAQLIKEVNLKSEKAI